MPQNQKLFVRPNSPDRLYFPRDCNLNARCSPSHNSKTFMLIQNHMGIRGKPIDKTKSQISHLLQMPLSLPNSGRLWEISSALVTSLIIWGCSNVPMLHCSSPPLQSVIAFIDLLHCSSAVPGGKSIGPKTVFLTKVNTKLTLSKTMDSY